MKKKILVFATFSAMALALSACSNSGAQKADETTMVTKPEEKQESGTNMSTTESEELTVWCWDPAFNIYAMQEAEKIYQKDHPNFKLNIVETPWPDVQTKLITAASANDLSSLPDILLMQDNAFKKNQMLYPEVFTDLESSGINFNDFAKAKVDYSVVDGKHYGVPFDNGAAIAAYRTDILEEAGFTVADFTDITWDEFIEKGKVVLEKTNTPLISDTAGDIATVMMMVESAGGSLFDDNGDPIIEGNEIIKESIETYVNLKNSGVLLEVNDWDQYVGSMTTSTVAGTIQGCWIIGTIQTATDQSGNWAITNMPKLNGINTATNYSSNGGSSWAITNDRNKDLAYDFLKSTFGSSLELYETILPTAGALATYIPAGESEAYSVSQEFFGGQKIYEDITDFASKIPGNSTGVFYYEGRDALSTAVQNIIQGADIDAELKTAQETVEFAMGK